MKKTSAILLLATLLPATAQILQITPKFGKLYLSINDTNHLWITESSIDGGQTWLRCTNAVGGIDNSTAPVLLTNSVQLFRAWYPTNAPSGFLIYAPPSAEAGGSPDDCTGTYIGQATYMTGIFGWTPTNNATLTISDPAGNGNTHIVAASLGGAFACGESPLTIANDGTQYIFTVYFRTNVPADPYPLRLSGFQPAGN